MSEKAKKILIVEDDKDILELLVSIFEEFEDNRKFRIICAVDGEEAVRLARAEIPDIILLDVLLPIWDGFEVCRRIKSDNATSSIKVIVMSGMTQDFDVQKALEVDADAFISKPFDYTKIVEKVTELLERNN